MISLIAYQDSLFASISKLGVFGNTSDLIIGDRAKSSKVAEIRLLLVECFIGSSGKRRIWRPNPKIIDSLKYLWPPFLINATANQCSKTACIKSLA